MSLIQKSSNNSYVNHHLGTNDALKSVFSNLEMIDLPPLKRVCKKFFYAITDDPRLTATLVKKGIRQITFLETPLVRMFDDGPISIEFFQTRNWMAMTFKGNVVFAHKRKNQDFEIQDTHLTMIDSLSKTQRVVAFRHPITLIDVTARSIHKRIDLKTQRLPPRDYNYVTCVFGNETLEGVQGYIFNSGHLITWDPKTETASEPQYCLPSSLNPARTEVDEAWKAGNWLYFRVRGADGKANIFAFDFKKGQDPVQLSSGHSVGGTLDDCFYTTDFNSVVCYQGTTRSNKKLSFELLSEQRTTTTVISQIIPTKYGVVINYIAYERFKPTHRYVLWNPNSSGIAYKFDLPAIYRMYHQDDLLLIDNRSELLVHHLPTRDTNFASYAYRQENEDRTCLRFNSLVDMGTRDISFVIQHFGFPQKELMTFARPREIDVNGMAVSIKEASRSILNQTTLPSTSSTVTDICLSRTVRCSV